MQTRNTNQCETVLYYCYQSQTQRRGANNPRIEDTVSSSVLLFGCINIFVAQSIIAFKGFAPINMNTQIIQFPLPIPSFNAYAVLCCMGVCGHHSLPEKKGGHKRMNKEQYSFKYPLTIFENNKLCRFRKYILC